MAAIPAPDVGSAIAHNYVFGAGSSLTVGPMTTGTTDEVILIAVVNTTDAGGSPSSPPTVDSITGGGLTFVQYAADSLSGAGYWYPAGPDYPAGFEGSGAMSAELWWAHAPTTLSGVTFTVTMSDAIVRATLFGIGYSGCLDPTAPWDTNGSLPAANAVTDGANSVTVSTDSTYDSLIFLNAIISDPVEDGDPDPSFSLTPSGFVFHAGGSQSGEIVPAAPSLGGSLGNRSAITTETDLVISTVEISGPLNASIFLAGALVGVPATPPPTPAVLNLDTVIVTSLTTESPCTALQFLTAPTVTPSLGLRWSDTRGATWGNAVPQALGTNPLAQPQWNRTGYARDRVFELFWSAAFKTALNGAFVEVVPWKS